jgi:DNA-binding NarL/FixJ family response regulator
MAAQERSGGNVAVLVVDDHPALRAGLAALLRPAGGLDFVGGAGDERELWPLLQRTRPDVVVLDYQLPGRDGLLLCREVKARVTAPAVVLYSAFVGPWLELPAALVGADALVDKGVPGRELCEVVRRVAAGERLLDPPPADVVDEAAARLEPEDLPVLKLLLDRVPPGRIAATLGLEPGRLGRQLERIVNRLHVPVPATGARP